MTSRFIVTDSIATVATELDLLIAGGVNLSISVFINIGVLRGHVQPNDRYVLIFANIYPVPEILVVIELWSLMLATLKL